MPAAEARQRYRVIYGGAGSGKSVFVAQNEIEHAADGARVLVVRKVARTLRHSTFQLVIDILSSMRRMKYVRVNRSDLRFDFPSGGALINIGLDDVEKVKSIAGINRIWIEEATELSKEDFQLLDLRLRGETTHDHQITLTFNPVPSWIKTYLVERKDEDSPDADEVYVQVTTHRDNPHVGTRYARVLSNLPEDLRKVYDLGEWGEAVRGLIYPNWTPFNLPIDAPTAYGLDFGFNAPSCLVAIEVKDPEIKVQELIYESHLTNQDLIQVLASTIPDRSIPIYCDAAEPARIEEIVRAGFAAYPADKSVSDGIDTVKRYKLQLHRNSVNLLREIKEYVWDTDRKTKDFTEKPLKRNDHAMDAMRYAIHSHCAETVSTWGMWE